MKKLALILALAAFTPAVAFAQAEKTDPGSLSDKAKTDNAGTSGGSTADPNAKPADSSLSDKAMKDQPATTSGGSTAAPTAEPKSGSLSDKAKETPATK